MEYNLNRPFLIPERNMVFMPDLPKYREICTPNTKYLVIRNKPMLATPNTPSINHMLWAMNEQVPSPMYNSGYDWSKQVPFATQIETAGMIVARRRCFVLSDMGVGKTLAALLAMDWLILNGYIKKALVIAPLAILDRVWEDEIRARMFRLNPIVVHGTRKERLQLLASPGWNVAIINYDGIGVVQNELIRQGFGQVIIDEVATLRNEKATLWKRVQSVIQNAMFVCGMTGTPTPNSPEDAYGQAKLLVPHKVPMSRAFYRDMVTTQNAYGVRLPKSTAKTTVYNTLQPSVRFKRSDVYEIKGAHTIKRKCTNSVDQKVLIEQLKTHMIAEYAEGTVKAANAGVLVGKLLQAYGGAVYTSERGIINLNAKNRIDQVMSLAEEAGGKVLIFSAFRHVNEILGEELIKNKFATDKTLITINGSTPGKVRSAAFAAFQDPHDPLRYINAHPKCMSHGLTLTQADTVIWYTPINSNETYTQANGRVSRLGQENEQMIYHITSGSATENKVYRTLQSNGNMQATILGLFESSFE